MRGRVLFLRCFMRKIRVRNPFRDLTKFELTLWLVSLIGITVSAFVSGGQGIANVIASLVGVTSLIFIAKGYVIGQALTIIFCIMYGIISLTFNYYGEFITYAFMTLPMGVVSLISWIQHPYEGTREVEVSRVSKKTVALIALLSVVVTAVFYFILRALDTANLIISTVSITTSFIAAAFSFFRSPYLALGYAANDVVLIVLWILAAMTDISYISMVLCFVLFLANDFYCFYNWRRMQKRQNAERL